MKINHLEKKLSDHASIFDLILNTSMFLLNFFWRGRGCFCWLFSFRLYIAKCCDFCVCYAILCVVLCSDVKPKLGCIKFVKTFWS